MTQVVAPLGAPATGRPNRWRWWLLVGLVTTAGSVTAAGSTAGGGSRAVLGPMFGGCAAAAVGLGIRRYRPQRWSAAGWWLIAAAVAFAPALSGSGTARLAPYPLLIAGLLLVARRPQHRRSWPEALLDTGILGLGLGAVAWSLVAQPLLAATHLGAPTRTSALALLAVDLGVLATVVRVMLVTGAGTPAAALLSAAGLAVLAGDAAFLTAITGLDARAGAVATVARLAAVAAVAAAALHPSMADPPPAAWSRFRGRLAVFVVLAPSTPVLVAAGAVLAARANRPYMLGDALIPCALGGVQSLLLVLRLGVAAGLARRRSRAYAQQARELAAALDDREQLRLRLDHHASHDALTGLANRTVLTERIAAMLAAGPDAGEAQLVLVDLDRFADVNDAHGHEVGDELLGHVASRLRTLLAPGDTVARLGADQFAMVLETGVADAGDLASAALDALRLPYLVDGRTIRVSGSAGVLTLAPGTTAIEALRDADTALQEAKRAGGNRHVVFAPELRSARSDHTRLAIGLSEALAGGEFTLEYQPVVEMGTRRIRSVESLLRWTRPDGEVIAPGSFIPVAEQTGLIGPIGAWALGEACRRGRSWFLDHNITLSVNVATHQLRDARFPEVVAQALAASGLPGRGLVLEITESALAAASADEAATVRERLERIRELGVRVAIDDFGTGYSSLAYLRQLPAEILKVDRAFVAGVEGRPGSDRAFLRAILQLASSVRMQTIVEGVETEEQARLLRMLGYPLAQGFLFHRPQAAGDIDVLLDTLDPADLKLAAG